LKKGGTGGSPVFSRERRHPARVLLGRDLFAFASLWPCQVRFTVFKNCRQCGKGIPKGPRANEMPASSCGWNNLFQSLEKGRATRPRGAESFLSRRLKKMPRARHLRHGEKADVPANSSSRLFLLILFS
jgi:hypothetical protein